MGRERRVLRATGFVPVEAKFARAAQREGLVLRGQLVDRLIESRDSSVVLVTAPPGYGKTVLVSQWAEEDDRPFAWLSLDDADNDPVVLVTYLMLALHRVEAVDAQVLSAIATDRGLADGKVPRQLGDMLRHRERSFVLVLDGTEALTSPVACRVVADVAGQLPAGSQLALVGRTALPLDWEAVRTRGRLTEITMRDLCLTRPETLALVAATGLNLSEQDVDGLLERTEGWAAGTYLIALSLSSAKGQASVDRLVAGDSLIADYVRDEVLSGLARDDEMFVLRTSILSSLSGPLCDAVLTTGGSGEVLERLAASDILTRLAESGWYRLRQPLAEAVHSELLRREPQVVQDLHSRARQWFEDHGDLVNAVNHAIAASEIERAARLIWSQTPVCLATGEMARLEAWLDGFSPQIVAAHAELALTAAWCALQRGRTADHWIAAAERGHYEAARKGESASVAAATALLRAVVARNGVVQMGADAQLALRLQDPEDRWAPAASLVDAMSTYLTGHTGEARSSLQRVERVAAATGAHQARVVAMGELALLAIDDDDWDSAQDLVDRATLLMREHGIGEVPMLLPVRCVAALLTARGGRTEDAEAAVRGCLRLVAIIAHPAAWAAVQCRHVLARAELALGDPSAARSLLSEAQGLLPEVPDAPVLRELLERTWRQIESVPLEPGGGASTLTSAELRVLQFLPTHLSFEEIGQQLFVSRNTVKTQAVSAYRKLGVSSRTDAVDRAYALGLIVR